MSTLIDFARRHVQSLMPTLEGEEDFMPFMTIRGRDSDGIIYVGLAMPDSGEDKDALADMMMAVCAIHRAVEVVFASTAWMVTRPDMKTLTRPSESPDRVETVFLVDTDENGDSTYSAPVTRKDNTVSIGEWSSFDDGAAVGGRFGEAVHMGMDLGRLMPPDMCEYIDEGMAAGRGDEIVASLIRALRKERARLEAVARN